MPSIIFGGLKYIQIRHAVYCKKCKETVESRFQYDYKICSCGAVGVDGGILDGNRFIGKFDDMETRCMYASMVSRIEMWLPKRVIEYHFAEHAKC